MPIGEEAGKKWDKRYYGFLEFPSPAEVLQQNIHLLPKQGKALDLACGLGANALMLASHGLQTSAWDISSVAIEKLNEHACEKGLEIDAQTRDVVARPPETESFDVIVVHRFLERKIFPVLINALKPRGLLFYQTFIKQKVSDIGPSNPGYLLVANELLQLCLPLQILFYREEAQIGDMSQGFRDMSMLVGCKSVI